MTDTEAAAAPVPPPNDLQAPAPPVAENEPPALAEFRKKAVHEPTFRRLRRTLREDGDWRSLATLMTLHAHAIAEAGAAGNRVVDLCLQAAEVWSARVEDLEQTAYVLALAFRTAPTREDVFEKLRDAYRALDWGSPLATLLRWRLEYVKRVNPAGVPQVFVELGEVGEYQFNNIERAIALYKQALALNPKTTSAWRNLIRLHVSAGAWLQAADLMNSELKHLDPAADADRFSELHLGLARIEHEQLDNIAAAAQHIHMALKASPDSVRALRAFGVLYLGSGKATEDGLAKAADVFYKAAKLARDQGEEREALKLARRSTALRPDHYDAGTLLAELLTARERWMELAELYATWIDYVQGEDAYGIWFARGDLLETRLSRREEARLCFEMASQFEEIGGDSWLRLERLYADLGNDHALVALYELFAEHIPDRITTEHMLTAARVYRENLNDDERASSFFYKVLEREPFNAEAFEGYKEHWRRKNNWLHLRDVILYQIDQAINYQGEHSPLRDPKFAEHFAEVAEICETRLGDIQGAIDAWNLMARCYRRDRRPREQLKRIERRTAEWEAAEQEQFDALAMYDDDQQRLGPLRKLAKLYRERLVDSERAMAVYDELVNTAPDDKLVLDGLIEVYERTGSWEACIELLRQQYDSSRAPAERVTLLRRMAELWQNELRAPGDAIWACEEILTFDENDLDALHRLQTLYKDHEQYDPLYSCLERESKLASDPKDKIRLLRRMANTAELHLEDQARATDCWYDLHDLDPHNLEIIDKLITAYDQAAQHEELADLLGRIAASKRTPKIRQLDYSLRLGALAEQTLRDPDRACSAYERALRIHRYHRGAIEALTRLYREIQSWHSLAATLETLKELADSDEEVLSVGWEQAEVLADHLDNATAALRVLEQLAAEVTPGNRDVALRLIDLYERAGQHRKLIRHAEILLLSSNEIDERRELFGKIGRAWIELADSRAATSAFSRFRAEFPDDPEGIRLEAELREAGGDHMGTLELLSQQIKSLRDMNEKVKTLERMAEVCERAGEPKRGLTLLGRALTISEEPEEFLDRIEAFAARHELFRDLLSLLATRFSELVEAGNTVGQVLLCLRAARVADTHLGDPEMAFSWARKGYFIALEHGLDSVPSLDLLETLAEKHSLWELMLGVSEQELKLRAGTPAHEDYATINLLMNASEIALERLEDPTRALSYLHRAHDLRPTDGELAEQIKALAERYELWRSLIELHERQLRRSESSLERFEACVEIARIYEKKLGDPPGAFNYLIRT
ncbi:MAG: hypothetical protein KC468_04620, partial [Myxococcales bacterium]|nr:hypothetical protein [Myxococcales bacterium]